MPTSFRIGISSAGTDADNQTLLKQPADPKRVVFMGDSITDFWRLTDSFPSKPYVNRGISGQTTSQMLVRMYPDVIALKPAAVIILAGTNDIARNNGPETMEMIEQNLMAMTELAQGHGIKVILCAVTPISDNPTPAAPAGGAGRGAAPGAGGGQGGGRAGAPPRRKQSEQRPPADILALNAWMQSYAAKVKAIYADYYTATADAQGMFKDGNTNDGLHPNPSGYTLMAPSPRRRSIERSDKSGALAWRGSHEIRVRADSVGPDDEPVRRRSDVRKRIARDERELSCGRRRDHPDVFRIDDDRVAHAVIEDAMRRRQPQLVANSNIPERPKQRVAVTGKRGVSVAPGQRRIRQMANRDSQRRVVIPFSNRLREPETRNVEHARERFRLRIKLGSLSRRRTRRFSIRHN